MIKPKKSLGQNFLQDKNIIRKIINLTEIYNENIIEIGPGLGSLTDNIIELKPKSLLLIEKDNELCHILKKKYINQNIEIINKDALKFDYSKFNNIKIISNLPYNISSKFLLEIIKLNQNVVSIICMIQSELADKFDLKKGKMNKYKFLSKYCSDYKIHFNVSRNVFYPKPNVDSTVVSFLIKNKKIDLKRLNNFIKFFFINKRKKIKSNKYFSNIDKHYQEERYEDLEYSDILKIYKKFKLSIS